MSENYLPFFRKYRPQAFCDLVGQESLVKALSNAIELNRFANAYLFCGPRGTGKTSSARIMAKSLNCVNGPTVSPCQKCPSCIDITNTSGLDVIEIDAATNRGIDDAKELISQVQYAPINGKYKIFIIDEVHMLSKEAFNALLKTFEEPPKNVIFILATTEPHKVIETIVSRCQRFDFRRITVDDIVCKLKEISNLEKIKITNDALLTIAKNVSGGLRDSLALLDQVGILGAKEEITSEMIENLIGKITFDPQFELTEIILQGDIENSLLAIEKIYSKGCEPRNFVENYIEFLRNLTIVINSKTPQTAVKFTSLSMVDVDKIVKNKSNYNIGVLLAILNKAIEFYKEIKSTTNPYLWVELMIIEMCGVMCGPVVSSIPIEPQIIQEIKQIKKAEVKKEAPVKIEEKTEEVLEVEPEQMAEMPVDIEAQEQQIEDFKEEPKSSIHLETSDVWARVIAAIKSPVVMPFFRDVPQSVEVGDSSITIGFVHPNAIIQAKSDSKFKALKEAVENVLDTHYEIVFMQVPKGEKTKNLITAQKIPQKPQMKAEYNVEQTQEPCKTSESKTEEEENIPKIYSDKTKQFLETFNGKVVD